MRKKEIFHCIKRKEMKLKTGVEDDVLFSALLRADGSSKYNDSQLRDTSIVGLYFTKYLLLLIRNDFFFFAKSPNSLVMIMNHEIQRKNYHLNLRIGRCCLVVFYLSYISLLFTYRARISRSFFHL